MSKDNLDAKDIILINPLMGGFEGIRGWHIEPTGLLYLSRLLLKDYKVLILDQRIEKNFFLRLRKLLEKSPLCIGITGSAGSQLKNALDITRFIKKHSPNLPIVFGGPFASQTIEDSLREPSIDYVVKSEGELSFKKLADCLAAGKSPKNIQGVYYLEKGEVCGEDLQQFLDLDQLPDIPYELLAPGRYFPVSYGKRAVSIESARGCPFKCGYCYNTVVHRSVWRAMSPQRALEHVQYALKTTKMPRIFFTDDNFFTDMARAEEILKGLAPLKISWGVQGVCLEDIRKMDDSMLSLLQKSGCEGLYIGIQTGSERIGRMFNISLDLSHVEEVNKKLKQYKIPCWYFFMCGFPTETLEDLSASANLAVKLISDNPYAVTSAFFIATPYPGTFLFNKAIEYGWTPQRGLDQWSKVGWNVADLPWLNAEQKEIVEIVYFLSLLYDKKSDTHITSPLIKLLTKIYRPIARYRLANLDFRCFFIENPLRKLAMKLAFK